MVLLVFVSVLPLTVSAQEPRPAETPEGPSPHEEITHTLKDVQRKYGSDAVMLEGHLLGHAVRTGSVGEAAVSVGGFEERDGKRFLTFKLDTGIIYNDREVSAAARPALVWSEIVEASLRKFRTLTVPADGVALTLGYAHRPYADEAELRAHLRDQPGDPEAAVFYLLVSDVSELIADRITGQQLVERSTAFLNGAPAHIVLAAPTPTPPADLLTH